MSRSKSGNSRLSLSAERRIKRLFLDLETSPNIVMTWRIGHKISLDHGNLLKERAIICGCWKWEGDRRVHAVHWDANQDDKAALAPLIAAINEADEVIAHNGDRFDVPWVRTRALFHKLPVINPQLKTIDTLQWARRMFYFNSNRLDYIARFLGLGGKIKTEYNLWKAVVLNKDVKALRKMVRYCQHDVVLLEKVWQRLSVMVKPKTHVGVLNGGPSWSCPRTGSINVKISKTRVTATGAVQYQFQCLDDGTYYTVSAKAHADYVEAKGAKR